MYKLKHIFTFWGPDFDIASVTELKHSTKSRSSDSSLSLPSQSTPSIHQLRSSQGTCLRQVPLCGFWLAAEVHWVCYARRVVVLFFLTMKNQHNDLRVSIFTVSTDYWSVSHSDKQKGNVQWRDWLLPSVRLLVKPGPSSRQCLNSRLWPRTFSCTCCRISVKRRPNCVCPAGGARLTLVSRLSCVLKN